jgi:hypothetical protein
MKAEEPDVSALTVCKAAAAAVYVYVLKGRRQWEQMTAEGAVLVAAVVFGTALEV